MVISLLRFKKALPEACQDPDLKRDVPTLIESRNFKYETHNVTTDDGYILTAHRILSPFPDSTAYPVILQHGLMASGRDFIVNAAGGTPEEIATPGRPVGNNLGFELAGRGYDVWLTNSRGNSYSRRHIRLDAERDKKFWDFSFDQKIEYDCPAFIEYIRKTTHSPTVGYVGHSQGCLIMFALLSIKPIYNQVVKPFIALSPVTTVGHIKSPFRFLAEQSMLLKLLRRTGGQFLPSNAVMQAIASRSNLLPDGKWP